LGELNRRTKGDEVMSGRLRTLRTLEGRQVTVALRDGTRIDSNLLSAGRRRTETLWLVTGGEDVFVPLDDVVDVQAGADYVSA
jgi:hypothetical protein